MKKKFGILFFVLSFSVVVKAQYFFSPEISIGTSQGVSGAFVLFSPRVDQQILLGYNGGISFRYLGERFVGTQVELNYIQRGWKENLDNNTFQCRLDYIEIPLMTQLFFGRKNRIFINFGPKISFNVRNKTVSDIDLNNTNQPQHTTKPERIVDFGVCAGLGYEFNAKRTVYQLEARYNCGLRSIFETRIGSDFNRALSQSFSVNLVFFFKLKTVYSDF